MNIINTPDHLNPKYGMYTYNSITNENNKEL